MYLSEAGLPSYINEMTQNTIYRCVRSATEGPDPVLSWTPPVIGARSMKLTLEDRSELPDSDRRYVLTTLRAKNKHSGKSAMDNVRVAVDMDGTTRIHFAR